MKKKSVEIIVDIKLLLTFAEVFDDRTNKLTEIGRFYIE